MRICITIGGQTHCYYVPELDIPFRIHWPGPGPVNYPQLLQDAVIVATLHTAASKVSDEGVRSALLGGMAAATQALQRRAGAHVKVEAEGAAGVA